MHFALLWFCSWKYLDKTRRAVSSNFSHVPLPSGTHPSRHLATLRVFVKFISKIHFSIAMSVKNWRLLVFCAFVALPRIRCAILAYDVDRNNSANSFNEITERPTGWLQAAQDMMASPAGHVVTQVAKELINRSTGNSQVCEKEK